MTKRGNIWKNERADSKEEDRSHSTQVRWAGLIILASSIYWSLYQEDIKECADNKKENPENGKACS